MALLLIALSFALSAFVGNLASADDLIVLAEEGTAKLPILVATAQEPAAEL